MIAPTDFLRIAVDPVRLAVLGSAARSGVDTAAIAADLRVSRRRVQRELGRLREAGLVSAEGRLDREVLQAVARALPQAAPPDPVLLAGPWSAEEAEMLGRFFSGSRLTAIPGQQAKRRLVLERLAQEFEPGLRYEEREVNEILQVFHPDHASLRRYLVEEGMLGRAEGAYWRTGGRTGDAMEWQQPS